MACRFGAVVAQQPHDRVRAVPRQNRPPRERALRVGSVHRRVQNQVRDDTEQKRVIYEPVKLTQAFRTFDFMSPWEGMTRQLPGDEKATGKN